MNNPNDYKKEIKKKLTLSPLEEMEQTLPEPLPDLLDETYNPAGQLNVPEKTLKRFKREGYSLVWVRVYINNGDLDVNNIRKKENDRHTFVTKEEAPEFSSGMNSYFTSEIDKHKDLIIVGDLALAKVPTAWLQKKRAFYEEQTRNRSRAIIEDLRKNSLKGEYRTTRDEPRTRDVDFGE
jgi:hypothetical protein